MINYNAFIVFSITDMKIRNPYIIWNVDSMGKFTILVNQQQQKTGIYMYFEIQMRNEFIYQQ